MNIDAIWNIDSSKNYLVASFFCHQRISIGVKTFDYSFSLSPVSFNTMTISMSINSKTVFFVSFECSIIQTSICIPDSAWAFHHVLAKHASVLKWALNYERSVALKVVIHEWSFIDFIPIAWDASAADDFIVDELAFVSGSISCLENTASVGSAVDKLSLIIISSWPSHSAVAFPDSVFQVSFVGPSCFVLHFVSPSKAFKFIGDGQFGDFADWGLNILAGFCLNDGFGGVWKCDYLSFVRSSSLRGVICGHTIAVFADLAVAHSNLNYTINIPNIITHDIFN